MTVQNTNNYWNGNGRFQALAKKLQARVPMSGPVENAKQNPKLERYRKAACVYYDTFNNGLCNRAAEFKGIFGFAARDYRRPLEHRQQRVGLIDFDRIVVPMDKVMDRIIIEAAAEQDLIEEAK